MGAGLILYSGFLVWFRVLGSELTGFRMADLITDVGDRLSVAPPSWIGAAWYLLPFAGVVSWILLFARSPVRPRIGHLVIGAAVAIACAGYMVIAADRADVTRGPVVALVGALLVLAGAVMDRWVRRSA